MHYLSPRVVCSLLDGGNDWTFLDRDLGDSIPQSLRRDAWNQVGERITHAHVFGEWDDLDDLTDWLQQPPPKPGTRPVGGWEFEAPSGLSDGESEIEFLCRHKLLLPGEAALLK
jgi:hypothetical protein